MKRPIATARVAERSPVWPWVAVVVSLIALLIVAGPAHAQRTPTLAEQTRALSATTANGTIAPEAPTTIVGTSAPRASSTSLSKSPSEITIDREAFEYSANGRRDPYKSLMTTSDLRPLLTDLKLTAVAFDPRGDNSVAILRDVQTKEQYRMRPGMTLGRMRVASIRPRAIVFTIEEFGFNRQESLVLSDTTSKARKP
jgi:uncharacterized protein YcfL